MAVIAVLQDPSNHPIPDMNCLGKALYLIVEGFAILLDSSYAFT